MREVWVQLPGFLGEAGDAIAALLGGAEFELEEGLVAGVYYAEVVGHGLLDIESYGPSIQAMLEDVYSRHLEGTLARDWARD